MPDFRAYCQPGTLDPRHLELDRDETHHLLRVSRARPGDTVVAFDGRGHEWICALEGERSGRAILQVRFSQAVPGLPYHMGLAQALPKGRHMADIVRKATELGATDVFPLLSERTVARVDEERGETKQDRWQDAALEACKQCGNSWLPTVHPVQVASAFLETARGWDLRLIASLQPGARHLREVFASRRAEGRPLPRRVLWVVGPEGDFTPAELGLAKTCGFEPVSLGPLVLRCETAAVCALSVLAYELQAGA